jgi:poly(ADP-ribose) glycohydrolase ARH3
VNPAGDTTVAPPSREDRFVGCLLAHALGDALGAPFEGLPPEAIYYEFGATRRLFDSPPDAELLYTDDTQMTIGVAECLLAGGTIEHEELARRFHDNYQPWRGYGPGVRKLLDAMTAGRDWREMVASNFPGGSLGNGAAMRAAPVGLLFYDDLDRACEEARRSATITHTHPIGVDGAVLMAAAVALVVRAESSDGRASSFDLRAFFDELGRRARTEEFQRQLRTAGRLGPDDAIIFGNSLEAHRSVTTALTCFAFAPDSYEDVVSRAIAMGNDTDTLAAMAGALSGARLGAGALPKAHLARLEDGPKGRSYVERLARDLYRQSQGVRP